MALSTDWKEIEHYDPRRVISAIFNNAIFYFFCMTIIYIYILYTLSYIGVLSDKRTLILYFHLRYFF